MKREELLQKLMKMQKDTEAGKLNWRLDVQTSEGNEEKYILEEEGESWTVDECYVSYHCTYQGQEFCMVTYEMLKSCEGKLRTVNYIFLPPLGVRVFSLHTLLAHSVDADAVLISQVHKLWEELIKRYKQGSGQVEFFITEAQVHIEEDA